MSVNIKENVERINTSYDPDHIDMQDHLNIGGRIRENDEGLNTDCFHGHSDLLYQASF